MTTFQGLMNSSRKNDTEVLRIDSLDSFERVYRENWDLLFNIAFKRLKSAEKTKEIIQELFVYLWENRHKIEIRESARAYLVTALRSRVLNHLRNEMIHAKHLANIQLNTSPFAVSPEKEIEYKELEASIERYIFNLPDKCRQVFLLSRQQHLSFKEISKKLNISVNTVEKHIGKALKILRLNLRDFVSFLVLSAFL